VVSFTPRGPVVSFKIETNNQSHCLSLDRVDVEFLFDLLSTSFGLNDLVSQWRRGSIPEALLGGLDHCSLRVLADFAGRMFIEDADELAHQLSRMIVAGRLSDGRY
jgi:hypothetical protein